MLSIFAYGIAVDPAAFAFLAFRSLNSYFQVFTSGRFYAAGQPSTSLAWDTMSSVARSLSTDLRIASASPAACSSTLASRECPIVLARRAPSRTLVISLRISMKLSHLLSRASSIIFFLAFWPRHHEYGFRHGSRFFMNCHTSSIVKLSTARSLRPDPA